jgi:RimJ/RimL family protein N-acetyltransferase
MRIVTARLVLRDFTEDDAPAFVADRSEPRYLASHLHPLRP